MRKALLIGEEQMSHFEFTHVTPQGEKITHCVPSDEYREDAEYFMERLTAFLRAADYLPEEYEVRYQATNADIDNPRVGDLRAALKHHDEQDAVDVMWEAVGPIWKKKHGL